MSQKASGYERVEGDRYFTPAWPVASLLAVEKFVGLTVDPCAGGWDVVDVLKAAGIPTGGFDIQPAPLMVSKGNGTQVDWVREHDVIFPQQDFLAWDGWLKDYHGYHHAMNFITNVPYGPSGRLAVKFIKHMLKLTEPLGGKVAVLLRVDFDSAGGRADIFRDHPAFTAKYTLTQRVRWVNMPLVYDKKGRLMQPSDNHAWFVWDWQKRREAGRVYGYLPQNGDTAS